MFGPIVSGRTVRLAMQSHLKLWFPTYLAAVARSEGKDPSTYPVFRSWVSSLDLPDGKYEEHQMPSCVIVTPGLLEEPERLSGKLKTVWAVSVGAVVSGQDRDNTFELAEMYAAAVRTAVMQHTSLGGTVEGVDWIGERFDDIPNDMLRTLAAGSVHFAVEVYPTLELGAGPDEPLVDPIPDPGVAATFVSVDATIEGADT